MNWDWFVQLYSISASFLIIGVAWKITIIPLTLVSFIFNGLIQKIYLSVISFIPGYFMASYASLITVGVNDGKASILLSIISGLFLALWLAMGVEQARKEMQREFSYENEYLITVRSWGTLITLVYFIYCSFDLRPAVNKITVSLYDLMIWVQDIPVVGIIVAILAFISAIYVVFVGLVAIIGMIFSMIPDKKKRDYYTPIE